MTFKHGNLAILHLCSDLYLKHKYKETSHPLLHCQDPSCNENGMTNFFKKIELSPILFKVRKMLFKLN